MDGKSDNTEPFRCPTAFEYRCIGQPNYILVFNTRNGSYHISVKASGQWASIQSEALNVIDHKDFTLISLRCSKAGLTVALEVISTAGQHTMSSGDGFSKR